MGVGFFLLLLLPLAVLPDMTADEPDDQDDPLQPLVADDTLADPPETPEAGSILSPLPDTPDTVTPTTGATEPIAPSIEDDVAPTPQSRAVDTDPTWAWPDGPLIDADAEPDTVDQDTMHAALTASAQPR